MTELALIIVAGLFAGTIYLVNKSKSKQYVKVKTLVKAKHYSQDIMD